MLFRRKTAIGTTAVTSTPTPMLDAQGILSAKIRGIKETVVPRCVLHTATGRDSSMVQYTRMTSELNSMWSARAHHYQWCFSTLQEQMSLLQWCRGPGGWWPLRGRARWKTDWLWRCCGIWHRLPGRQFEAGGGCYKLGTVCWSLRPDRRMQIMDLGQCRVWYSIL